MSDLTTIAPEPQRWVCPCCGKTSASRCGLDAEGKNVATPGWDESCMMNAVLCVPVPMAEQLEGGPVWRTLARDLEVQP